MGPATYLYGAIFLTALFLVDGLVALIRHAKRGGDAANRRLRLLSTGVSGEDVLRKLKSPSLDEGHVLHRRLMAFPPYASLDRSSRLAGLGWPTVRLLGWGLGLTATLFLVALGLLGLSVLQAAAAAAVGVILPAWVIGAVAGRRNRLFQSQLVDAIDIIVRSLRAGHPIVTALSLVAREMPDPLGSEFGLTFDEMTYGLDLRDALENLARRVANPELHYLVVAIRVQYGTGGNLAEVLASLSKVLRERNMVQVKIAAWSAEGRLSAWILSVMPVLVGLVLNTLNPDYYRAVQDDPLFPQIMGAGLVALVSGMLLMRHMVKFKV